MTYLYNGQSFAAVRIDFDIGEWLIVSLNASGKGKSYPQVRRLNQRPIAEVKIGERVAVGGELVDEIAVEFYFAPAALYGGEWRIVNNTQLLNAIEHEALLNEIAQEFVQRFCRKADPKIWGTSEDPHPTVDIRLGDMHATVDVLIAPILQELWRLEIHTTASCQEFGAKKMAYVEMLVQSGNWFCKFLEQSGISYQSRNRNIPNCSIHGLAAIPAVQIFFNPRDIERVTSTLRDIPAG